jgi:hypothetical protein
VDALIDLPPCQRGDASEWEVASLMMTSQQEFLFFDIGRTHACCDKDWSLDDSNVFS